jgi:hypothetical protein
MSRPFTVALRICVSCGTSFGLSLWPWSGERFTRTHGLCRRCFERLDASFDEERTRRARPPLAPSPEAH